MRGMDIYVCLIDHELQCGRRGEEWGMALGWMVGGVISLSGAIARIKDSKIQYGGRIRTREP